MLARNLPRPIGLTAGSAVALLAPTVDHHCCLVFAAMAVLSVIEGPRGRHLVLTRMAVRLVNDGPVTIWIDTRKG